MTSKRVLLIIVVPLLLFALLFITLQLANRFDKQPTFFPLDDSQASYTILKSPYGNSSCEQDQKNNYSTKDKEYYVVRYKGDHVFAGLGKTKCFDIYIGKSPNLDSFIGIPVMIEGEFVSSSNQCVGNACTSIGGPYVVLDIHSVKQALK